MASTTSGLSPPGTGVYSSNTLHVGDGTWDSTRDDFLLPNIMGLNFDTMRYNGMGNRFAGLAEYHSLITGHGVLAAITFLGVVPAAILIASFYHRNPGLALRLHISLQVLTVILATVVLVLGYFAVGPHRSLTNPHHGIGVAIYVLVLVQALGGWLMHRIEKGKMRYHVPIKLMLHQWLGRAIALLALAQIPIGLTLYGSPLVLFILYALVMFFYLVLYFVLIYRKHRRVAQSFGPDGSYISGTEVTQTTEASQHHSGWKKVAGLGAAGAGLAALRNRRKSHNRSESGTEMLSGAGAGTESDYYEEKSDYGRRSEDHTWRNRILGGAAGVGAIAAAKKLFGGKDREPDSPGPQGRYRPRQDGPVNTADDSATNLDRLESGYARPSGPGSAMGQSAAGQSRVSGDSYASYDTAESRRRNRFGKGLAGLTSFGALGAYVRNRKTKKERARAEAEEQRRREEHRLFGPAQNNAAAGTSFQGPAPFSGYAGGQQQQQGPPPQGIMRNTDRPGQSQVSGPTQSNVHFSDDPQNVPPPPPMAYAGYTGPPANNGYPGPGHGPPLLHPLFRYLHHRPRSGLVKESRQGLLQQPVASNSRHHRHYTLKVPEAHHTAPIAPQAGHHADAAWAAQAVSTAVHEAAFRPRVHVRAFRLDSPHSQIFQGLRFLLPLHLEDSDIPTTVLRR